jgi:hypothetical protein
VNVPFGKGYAQAHGARHSWSDLAGHSCGHPRTRCFGDSADFRSGSGVAATRMQAGSAVTRRCRLTLFT